ncbi:MAG: histidine kinase [Verrucomicrobiota bacterium]
MPLTTRLSQGDDSPETISIGTWRWRVSFWPLQFAVWGAYSIFPIFLWLSDVFKNSDALCLALLRPLSGFLITSAVRPLWRRLAERKPPLVLLFVILVVGNLPLAALDYLGSVWFLNSIGIFLVDTHPPHLLAGFFFIRWISLVAWSLLYFIAKQTLHNRALVQANRITQMEVLRAQIHPHFLFNALNSIVAEAKNFEKVREITLSLADFLRFSLQAREGLEPLELELKALENYMRVQKVRFEERLDYKIDAEPAAAACLAPAFLILPLLENALKYGQLTSPLPLRVYVAASVRGKQLKIAVKNSGRWIEPIPAKSLISGIANLKKRLALLYGTHAAFSVEQTEDGVIASLSLPITQPNS